MNKEYTYVDGKVIISDENNTKTQREYCDNLDKVLIQENVIETMEKQIQELEKKLNRKNPKKRFIPFVFLLGTLFLVLLTILFSSLTYKNFLYYLKLLKIPYIIESSLCLFLDFNEYSIYKDEIKKENGLKSELVVLKKQIEVEKERLKDLEQEKSRCKENNEFRTVIIDDLEQLKILKNWLNLYFELGYNEEKYYRWYQQGLLDKKMGNYYNETGIQLAKEYIEENVHSLTLKYKKNNSNNSEVSK